MRKGTVSGTFYPDDPYVLEQMLSGYFGRCGETEAKTLGVVSPHAGYLCSGQTAAIALSAFPTDFSGTFVVIGPSHMGIPTCTSPEPWWTPLGAVETDEEFIDALDIRIDKFGIAADENSLEIQMPLIRYRFPDARIAPVLMGNQSYESAVSTAKAIYDAIGVFPDKDIRIIASSDFSHYIPDDLAEKTDLYVIDALLELDVTGFYSRLAETKASVCGYGPISAMMLACIRRGAEKCTLLEYTTSGRTCGGMRQVVGYAAISVM